MLEVCIDSLESAVNAIHGGADELEVCSSLSAGGLTPTAGLVKQILYTINNLSSRLASRNTPYLSKPKVNVMLRCREGWDFCYSPKEMETMLTDLELFKEMGVDRFVFGALSDTQAIDVPNCLKVIEAADPIPVTFHRAFDIVKDPTLAMDTIINTGFNRVLTSGQRSSAGENEALYLIKTMVNTYGQKIEIMPGAGVTADNARIFIDMGCKIVHSTCKIIKKLPSVQHSLGNVDDINHIYVSDENIVRKLKDLISG